MKQLKVLIVAVAVLLSGCSMISEAGAAVTVGDVRMTTDQVSNQYNSIYTTLNGKTLSSPLKVGQVICLPQGAKRPSATTTTQPRAATSSGSTSSSGDMRNVTNPSVRSYSRTEVEQIVRDIWPDNLENDALFVVERESHFNPGSRSYCCIGLFQLNWSAHKKWMANYGVTDPAQLLDPTTNARMALVARERAGSWRPWCTSSWCPAS